MAEPRAVQPLPLPTSTFLVRHSTFPRSPPQSADISGALPSAGEGDRSMPRSCRCHRERSRMNPLTSLRHPSRVLVLVSRPEARVETPVFRILGPFRAGCGVGGGDHTRTPNKGRERGPTPSIDPIPSKSQPPCIPVTNRATRAKFPARPGDLLTEVFPALCVGRIILESGKDPAEARVGHDPHCTEQGKVLAFELR